MGFILLKNAKAIMTWDGSPAADILVRERRIEEVGSGLKAPEVECETIDCRGKVVIPGLVNTHHHLYQTLCRAIPCVQDAELFDWLADLYEVWREFDEEAVHVSALCGIGELLLTGCTTTADMYYVFPKGKAADLIDREIEAARLLGIRFHPARGAMSRGRSKGGLPPDDVVQDEDEILRDCERLVSKHHDPLPFSMCRINVAPCSPFSVTEKLLRDAAGFARANGLLLHTHLAETLDEQKYCVERYGTTPLGFMEKIGWVGPDVWFAHCVHLTADEVKTLSATKTGVAHCPTSNMRLGSGIAPVAEMLREGVRVGLAVDGSASNDSSDMLAEVRAAMLASRLRKGGGLTARQALGIATKGGAAALGRDDIGELKPGKAADIAVFDVSRLPYAGSMHDPVAALVFCGACHVADTVIVNGKVVVRGGRLAGADESRIVADADRISGALVAAAQARTGKNYLARRSCIGEDGDR